MTRVRRIMTGDRGDRGDQMRAWFGRPLATGSEEGAAHGRGSNTARGPPT
ncbi:hypothetical protein ABT115_22925 [Streptomyces sp. NPDC001832]